jgi:hypothetical protein
MSGFTKMKTMACSRLGVAILAAVVTAVVVGVGYGSTPDASGLTKATDGQGGNSLAWVSGVGDDANPCTRTAPCKTWSGAVAKTEQPGGEVDAYDPGNFGPVTIPGGMILNGGPGVASVQAAGTDGIDISAAATDTVILRNLDIQGKGSGLEGINFISGKALYIENSIIEGFTEDAVHVAPTAGGRVVVDNVTIRNNGQNGVSASSGSAAAPAVVTINDSRIEGNGATGVLAADNSDVTVDTSTLSGNGQGLACVTQLAGSCTMSAATDVIDQNTTGVLSGRGVATATGSATVYITDNNVFANTTGLAYTTAANGKIISFGDNTLMGNTTAGKPSGKAKKV